MEKLYRELLMRRSPQERFLMGVRMCAAARETVMASMPAGLTDTERKCALLRRYYTSELSETALQRIEEAITGAGHFSATRVSDTSAAAPV